MITDEELAELTQLTYLDISNNDKLIGKCLPYLTNVTELLICSWSSVRGSFLACMTQLTSLNLHYHDASDDYPDSVRGECLTGLTNLTSLDIGAFDEMFDRDLQKMTRLVSLSLEYNTVITNNGLSTLTNLTKLNLTGNQMISRKDLPGTIQVVVINNHRCA